MTANIVHIDDPLLMANKVDLFIKRDDLLPVPYAGNKWYKLKYNIQSFLKGNYESLLTFGGAYSNHIHAAAAAGAEYNIKTIGVIRGEPHEPLNPTLRYAASMGMRLHYINRQNYRNKYSAHVMDTLRDQFGNFYMLPEGGTNALAVKGCREIIENISINYDVVCVPCGTGGTLAGIVTALPPGRTALGIAVLKGADFLKEDVSRLIRDYHGSVPANWNINTGYHFGGYAKFNSELLGFIKEFKTKHDIPLEPVYTGKMFYALYDLISQGYFPPGTTILAVHTGGLQGLNGIASKIDL